MNIMEKLKSNSKLHSIRALFLHMLCVSALITVICQMLQCRSALSGIAFIFAGTYQFIMNVLILLVTHCIAFFFKRRLAVCNLISVMWLVFGIANFIVTLKRPSPITAIDFVILPTTIDVLPHYLDLWQMILIGVSAAIIITLSVFAVKRARLLPRRFPECCVPFAVSALLLGVFIHGGKVAERGRIEFADPKKAYDENGVVYAFASTVFDKGIPTPEDYSGSSVKEIVEKYKAEKRETENLPNILFVQLESFLDVENYAKYTFTKDPTPNFHRITEKYGEKGLIVPSYGGGTVNTEFEVLTGMDLDFFGAVEYPYNTILTDRCCESLPSLLRPYGYTSHAVHDHTGVFYGRDRVYPNLGFDTFTPLEYMQYETNELGWAKDVYLLPCIKDCIESTSGSDFVFAVTVEGHGLYDENEDSEDEYGILSSADITEETEREALLFEDYCRHISETDLFIGELYDYVTSSEEKFIVVLYGDHLPSLEFASDAYRFRSDYATQYTVFTNYKEFDNYPEEDTLEASLLSSTILDYLGIDSGIISLINRAPDSPSHDSDLCEIQYDMLYGDGYSLGYFDLEKNDMRFGVKDITIESVTYENGYLNVRGEGFTKASEICVNGWSKETEFIDSTELLCKCTVPEEGSEIKVCQKAVDGSNLGEVITEYK